MGPMRHPGGAPAGTEPAGSAVFAQKHPFLLAALLLAVCRPAGGATFRTAGTTSLAQGRRNFTLTVLPNGNALIAGGSPSGSAVSGTEIYDPIAGSWTSGPAMGTARAQHAAI